MQTVETFYQKYAHLVQSLVLIAAFLPGFSALSQGADAASLQEDRLSRLASLTIDMDPSFAAGDTMEAREEQEAVRAEGPCLPLHTVEGNGGHFSVMTAYITNPAAPGELLGKPSLGFIHVDLNHGKHLEAFTITETLLDRFELGYAYNVLDVGDLYEDFNNLLGTPGAIGGHAIHMHNFNARVQIFKEGEFDQSWLPAITVGAHYKINDDLDDVEADMDAVVPGFFRNTVGIKDDSGVDYTLFASKMLTFLPRPLIVSLGARSTEAAHIGLLGFTGHRQIVAEGGLCFMATDNLVFAAEYRQKPNTYDTPPGTEDVLAQEDDWWTVDAGYLVNSQLSLAVGYGHFGHLLNHTANRGFGVAIKYEF